MKSLDVKTLQYLLRNNLNFYFKQFKIIFQRCYIIIIYYLSFKKILIKFFLIIIF